MDLSSQMTEFTPYHSQYLAHRLTLEGATDDAFAKSLSTARVDLNPHQVDAALFALASPISKGVILADEVGLGKTIEASLVIAQRWAEHRRRILLIVPASFRSNGRRSCKTSSPFLPSSSRRNPFASRSRLDGVSRWTRRIGSSSRPTSSPPAAPTTSSASAEI